MDYAKGLYFIVFAGLMYAMLRHGGCCWGHMHCSRHRPGGAGQGAEVKAERNED